MVVFDLNQSNYAEMGIEQVLFGDYNDRAVKNKNQVRK